MRVICLVDGDGDALGRIGELRSGIDDAAVVLFAVPCRQDEQTVGEREERVLFDRRVRRMLRRSGLRHGIEDGLRHCLDIRQLRFLERRFDRDRLVEDRAVLELLELRAHESCRRRRPGAVFHQGDGAVLQIMVDDIVHQIFHRHEHPRVVRRGDKDQMTGPEALGKDVARVRDGHVIHLHVAHAEVGQLRGQNIRGVFRAAVDGSIGDDDCIVLRGIGRPVDIFVEEPRNIFAPDRAVQRADHLNLQPGSLFQQRLYLRAVFSDNVGVIPAGIGKPFCAEIHLVRVQIAVQRAEGAEGVGGIERFRRCVIGHHDLRPMHHRGHDESKGVFAGRERVHLLDELQAAVNVKCEEILHHRARLGVADDGYFRMAQDKLADGRGVVGLHVLHDEIVELPAGEHMVDVFKEQAADGLVHGVDQDGLLVQQQIGVVAHAVRERVGVFKQVQPPLACADPVEILGHFLDTVHSSDSFQNIIMISIIVITQAMQKIQRNFRISGSYFPLFCRRRRFRWRSK